MRNHPAKAGRSIEFDLLASLALGGNLCHHEDTRKTTAEKYMD
jgi:hypothetical protein